MLNLRYKIINIIGNKLDFVQTKLDLSSIYQVFEKPKLRIQ